MDSKFIRDQAERIQKDLRSENEFKHRGKWLVNYDLMTYNICQKLIDCHDKGGDANALLISNMDREAKAHKEFLAMAEKSGDPDGAPISYWTNLATEMTIAHREL